MIAPTMLVAAAAAETSSTSAWAPMWNITRPESVTDASGKTTANSASPVSCSWTEGSLRSKTARATPTTNVEAPTMTARAITA